MQEDSGFILFTFMLDECSLLKFHRCSSLGLEENKVCKNTTQECACFQSSATTTKRTFTRSWSCRAQRGDLYVLELFLIGVMDDIKIKL